MGKWYSRHAVAAWRLMVVSAWVAFLVIVVFGIVAVASESSASVCHVNIERGLPGPDNALRCTPGAFRRLTRADVCDGDSSRATLRAADRREVVGEYGVPGWSGRDGELDHRVPVFLGGRTVPANIWPEPGSIPNAKDRVEFRVYRRVCFSDPAPMRVRTARRIFLADWRHTYRVWLEDGSL